MIIISYNHVRYTRTTRGRLAQPGFYIIGRDGVTLLLVENDEFAQKNWRYAIKAMFV